MKVNYMENNDIVMGGFNLEKINFRKFYTKNYSMAFACDAFK